MTDELVHCPICSEVIPRVTLRLHVHRRHSTFEVLRGLWRIHPVHALLPVSVGALLGLIMLIWWLS